MVEWDCPWCRKSDPRPSSQNASQAVRSAENRPTTMSLASVLFTKLEREVRLYRLAQATHPVSPSCKLAMEVPVDFANIVEWGSMLCLASPVLPSPPNLFPHRWWERRMGRGMMDAAPRKRDCHRMSINGSDSNLSRHAGRTPFSFCKDVSR